MMNKDRIDFRSKRDSEFLNLYTIEGKTLQEIGDIYGISRERVRQRLKVISPERLIGGKSLQVAIRKIHAPSKEDYFERKCFDYFGCSVEFRDSHGKPNVNGTLSNQFLTQKNNARNREVPFLLTFPQWLQIWQESGHINERGLGKGKYHMTRVCDSGPYSVDNVEIKLHEENSKEARLMDKVYQRGNVHIYEYEGAEYTLKELAMKLGMKPRTLEARVSKGISLQDACNTPVKAWGR
jgi:hypothetical protein